jgi:hypothetical protein
VAPGEPFVGYLRLGDCLYNSTKAISYYSADRFFSAIIVGILSDLVDVRKQNTMRDGIVKGFVQRAFFAPRPTAVEEEETSTRQHHLYHR